MTLLQRSSRAALLVAGLALLAGCQEDLTGGASCPALCPEQQLGIKDTVLVAEQVLDTAATVAEIPPLGTEAQVLLAKYASGGDSIVSVGLFRFDSLPRFFPDTDTTTPPKPFAGVKSANFAFTVLALGRDTLVTKDSVTFELIDADTTAGDLDLAAIAALFRSRPVLADTTVARDSLARVITINLDSAFVASHVRNRKRIRLGLRATNATGVRLRVASVEGAALGVSAASLRYTGLAAPPDTSTVGEVVAPRSLAQVGPLFSTLADYQVVLHSSPAAPAGTLVAGGLPSSRIYLRFTLPQVLLDSSTTVVRANLELHQMADPTFPGSDSLTLTPRVVIATPEVTDIGKAALLLADPNFLGLRSTVANPARPRIDTVALASNAGNVITFWRVQDSHVQRAIAIQSSGEGTDPRRFLIFSGAAVPDSLRPRLHVTYIPRSGFGLP